MTTTARYDAKPLLDSFRALNQAARDCAKSADSEDALSYVRSAEDFSGHASDAADAAEAALQSLNQGDTTPAVIFLDRIAHSLGMMSTATHSP